MFMTLLCDGYFFFLHEIEYVSEFSLLSGQLTDCLSHWSGLNLECLASTKMECDYLYGWINSHICKNLTKTNGEP